VQAPTAMKKAVEMLEPSGARPVGTRHTGDEDYGGDDQIPKRRPSQPNAGGSLKLNWVGVLFLGAILRLF